MLIGTQALNMFRREDDLFEARCLGESIGRPARSDAAASNKFSLCLHRNIDGAVWHLSSVLEFKRSVKFARSRVLEQVGQLPSVLDQGTPNVRHP